MDPIDKLNLKLDSSLRMAFALRKQGAEVFYAAQQDLSRHNKSKYSQAKCHKILFKSDATTAYLEPANESEPISLSKFSGIHMRKDPPYDLNYISTTWLLDAVPETTKIINHPHALRGINEKLSIFLFDQYSDKALLSSSSSEILSFIKEDCGGDAIIKPLDLFGGKGIERLNIAEGPIEEITSKILEHTSHDKELRLIQPFNKHIFEGEIRAFSVAGVPLSYCLKRPSEGSYLANTGSGATLEPYTPTAEVDEMITKVSEELLKYGVFIAGFDIIGGLISEINITSPRLLLSEGENESNYYNKMAEEFIKYCQ